MFTIYFSFTVEFLKSQKGKRILRFKGYTYYSQYVGLKTRWLCSTHYPKGCRASIYTINDKVIKVAGEHIHAAKTRLQTMPKIASIVNYYTPKNSSKYETINFQQKKEFKFSTVVQRKNQNVQQYLNIKNDIKTEQLNISSPVQSHQNISNLYNNISNPSSALIHSFNVPQLMSPGTYSQYHEKRDQHRLTGDQVLNRFDHSGFYNYDGSK